MKKPRVLNRLRDQPNHLLGSDPGILKVPILWGTLKNIPHYPSPHPPTDPGETQRGSLFGTLQPTGVHISQYRQSPQAETDQTQPHKSMHGKKSPTLIIPQPEVLLGIPNTDFQVNLKA